MSQKNASWTKLLGPYAVGLAFAISGCSAENCLVGKTHKGVSDAAKGRRGDEMHAYINQTTRWPNATAAVCWDATVDDAHQKYIKRVLDEVFHAATEFKFTWTGFQPCPATQFAGVRVVVTPERGRMSANTVGYARVGARVNISSDPLCEPGPRCWTWSAVAHEFGHILGFFHEQDRPDSQCNIGKGQVIRSLASSFGAYDADSIMNYCRSAVATAKGFPRNLSAGDTAALKFLYPPKVAPAPESAQPLPQATKVPEPMASPAPVAKAPETPMTGSQAPTLPAESGMKEPAGAPNDMMQSMNQMEAEANPPPSAAGDASKGPVPSVLVPKGPMDDVVPDGNTTSGDMTAAQAGTSSREIGCRAN